MKCIVEINTYTQMSVKQRKSSLLTHYYHFPEFHINGFYVFFQNFSLFLQVYTYITIQFGFLTLYIFFLTSMMS